MAAKKKAPAKKAPAKKVMDADRDKGKVNLTKMTGKERQAMKEAESSLSSLRQAGKVTGRTTSPAQTKTYGNMQVTNQYVEGRYGTERLVQTTKKRRRFMPDKTTTEFVPQVSRLQINQQNRATKGIGDLGSQRAQARKNATAKRNKKK